MNERHKKVCGTLSYFGHVLIFDSTLSVCVSISAFVSLVGAPVVLRVLQ